MNANQIKPHSLTEIFPNIPTIKRLKVLSVNKSVQSLDFWIWLRSFQGLINSAEPHIYIIPESKTKTTRPMYEDHWLDYYTENFDIAVEYISDIDEFIEDYKEILNGYVIYDTKDVVQTQNMAITRAGLENILPIAPDQEEWMIRHGIKKVDDLRNRFNNDWDAAEWMIENLWPKCNKRMYGNFCIHRPTSYSNANTLLDYITYNKAMAIDLPRGRTHRRSLGLFNKMMQTADSPGVQLNWHCSWEQEKEYVGAAARNGFFTLCSSGTPNLSIHGGVGDSEKAFVQPLPEKKDCVAEKGKIYVCLYNSDGDATWAMNNLHSSNWLEKDRGKFKFGWGFLPLMVKMMPAMLQYYHETKTENDCFWGPSSGAGYTYSHLWPDNLVDMYLTESRRLLDQSGQNGCNMVNWNLQDWWREVEDDEAIKKEQDLLKSGPGLVCGLGGSPYATSYVNGAIPKLHSIHIASVEHDTISDILKFSKECTTRPLFMFLFAQISVGIFEQMENEMKIYENHPEIELISMDEFFLTLQDGIEKGLVKDELYENNDAIAETWLKAPGRNRLPLYERLTEELAAMANSDKHTRRKSMGDAAWTDLVSKEIEGAAGDREEFLKYFEGRMPPSDDEEADALLYIAFTVAWGLVRVSIQSKGIYANHRNQCLADFIDTCGDIVDTKPIEKLFKAWENWEDGVPTVEETAKLCSELPAIAKKLTDALGPDEEESFTNWPPRTI